MPPDPALLSHRNHDKINAHPGNATPAIALLRWVGGALSANPPFKAENMFLLLALILILAWAGFFFLFHVTAFLIHILLIFALISLVFHFISGRKAA